MALTKKLLVGQVVTAKWRSGADTERSAKSVIEAFRGANVNILAQEFIKESGGTDIRAIVVGAKVVAAMKRTGQRASYA